MLSKIQLNQLVAEYRGEQDGVASGMTYRTIEAESAGIAEMLLQSHTSEIHLLPALPKAWPNGHVKGLRARGGFEVDISWRQGKLEKAHIRSMLGKQCTVRCGERTVSLQTVKGITYTLNHNLRANPS